MSKKPGVRASIVLDRASGAILKTNGELSALRTAKSRDAATAASFQNEAPAAEESESRGVDDFAAMIWNFVNTSGHLVEEVDADVSVVLSVALWSVITNGVSRRTSYAFYAYEPRNRKLSLYLTPNTFSR